MDNRQFYMACCSNEHALFHKVFQAVPDDGLDWRPEPRARSTRELVGHLIGHEQDLVQLIEEGQINHRNQVPFDNMEEALSLFDAAHEKLSSKLAGMDDDAWGANTKFWVGDHLAWEAPASQLMWGFLFDSIHHRGQLTTYLRPTGSKVPAIYGPSADDDGS